MIDFFCYVILGSWAVVCVCGAVWFAYFTIGRVIEGFTEFFRSKK